MLRGEICLDKIDFGDIVELIYGLVIYVEDGILLIEFLNDSFSLYLLEIKAFLKLKLGADF